nr:reverse transcriptase domain-containing protein [Tanacetum cinerariifolium]
MDKVRRDKRKEVHASETYSPSTTKSRPGRTSSKDHPGGRSRPHRLDASDKGRHENRERFRSVRESYDDSHSSNSYHNRDRSRHMKRRRASESPLSSVDLFTLRIRNFKSSRRTRMPNNVKTYDGTGDLEDHVKIFQAAAQQKKYVKDPVEIHNIKQKDGETIEDFMERFKVETGYMKGAPEWEAAAANKKKGHTLRRTQDQSKRQTSEKRTDFRGHPREGRGSSRFTPLTRTPKEILAAKAGKFQPPPPMVTPKIEELVRAGKLSHLIKEIKHGRDQSKVGKKETSTKDKPVTIYMIQSWQRMTRKKLTQSFERVREIRFPLLATSSGAEGSLVIEAEISGHMIHHMLLVTIGDTDHSTRAWMNFMIVRSLSPYNGIIGRPGIKEIQAVQSTAHGMLKFPADGGIVIIRSTILIPAECAMVITSSAIPKEVGVRLENFKVAIHLNFPDQEVSIGGTLFAKGRTELCSLLKKNLDIFAWQPSNMTGVPRSVAEHRFNIREGYSPVRQKKKGQAPERAKAIQAEV